MSRKEDIVFCKIALTNGLITQEAAQKALALCDKKERETGRRPLIGALFTKHNLMNNQEVKRIYTAVQKRLGTTVGPQLPTGRARGRGGRKGRKGRGRGHDPRLDRRGKSSRPIDPKTLWMGIGGMVVFLGIMVVLILMVLNPSGPSPEETAAGGVAGQGGATPGVAGGSGGSSLKGPGGGPGGSSKVAGGAVMPERVKIIVDQKIKDARSEIGTMAPQYLTSLRATKKELAAKGYPAYEPLEAMIKELEDAVAAEGGEATPEEGTSQETPAAAQASPGAETGGSAKKPPPSKPEAKPPQESELDLGSGIEGEL